MTEDESLQWKHTDALKEVHGYPNHRNVALLLEEWYVYTQSKPARADVVQKPIQFLEVKLQLLLTDIGNLPFI